MSITYALFDESNDEYIPLGTFECPQDAEIAASEHGLPEDGTEYYVERAVPHTKHTVRDGVDHYLMVWIQEDPVSYCEDCLVPLYNNDWIWDGMCITCSTWTHCP